MFFKKSYEVIWVKCSYNIFFSKILILDNKERGICEIIDGKNKVKYLFFL